MTDGPATYRPNVFVGTSTEARAIAESLRLNLEARCDVQIRVEGRPGLNESATTALVRAIETSDFAVFVLSPDDRLVADGREWPAPRDNILFEFGFFAGALGLKRVLVLKPDGVDLKIPSDLADLSILSYASEADPDDPAAATREACQQILTVIERKGPLGAPEETATLAGAIPYRIGADGTVEILLVTTKERGNWSIPKGKIDVGESAVDAARRETHEEAGAMGTIHAEPVGTYSYRRLSKEHEVTVYAMAVTEMLDDWDEIVERDRLWHSATAALEIVNELGLARAIDTFLASLRSGRQD